MSWLEDLVRNIMGRKKKNKKLLEPLYRAVEKRLEKKKK